MDGRRRRRVKEQFDLGLGFTGFFVLAFVGITVYLEISRKDALWPAVTALLLMLFEWTLWTRRQKALHRHEDSESA